MVPPDHLTKAEKTYSGFIATLKWAVPVIAVIVFLVILLIS